MFIKYISAKGWTLYKIYKDVDSGTHGKRSGFIEMVEDAKAGKFDVVLAKELSRPARNIGISHEFKQVIMANNIHIICLDGSINTLEDDISKYGLFAWLYEDESRRISKRIKSAKRSKALRAEFLSGDPPYGYTIKSGQLIPRDDETVEVVKKIYQMYIEGYGTEYMARELTNQGYPTPSQIKEKKNAGRRWHGTTIKLILKNIHYTGILSQCVSTTRDITTKDITTKDKIPNKEPVIIENSHEPIISKEKYMLVQQIMQERSQKSRVRATPKKHLFSDKLFCRECGKKLWLIKSHKSYYCGTFKKYGRNHCNTHKIKESTLKEILQKDLKKFADKFNDYEKIKASINKKIQASEKTAKYKRTKYEARLQEIKEIKSKLIIKFSTDELTKEAYDLATTKLDEESNAIELKLIEIKNILNKKLEQHEELDRITKLFDSYKNFENITREVVNMFIDKIIIGENQEIKIIYNFAKLIE
jgi:DNA invertase Pin-like site-specific DNA recombinase